jgi:hypothetical protein
VKARNFIYFVPYFPNTHFSSHLPLRVMMSSKFVFFLINIPMSAFISYGIDFLCEIFGRNCVRIAEVSACTA